MSDSVKTQRPPGTETCGCCDGIAASTPTGIFNRAGLSAIGYRIGDYASFKQTLQAGLSSSAWPPPPGLRTRDADDYTLGLIDAVSCAADVLTFYQERIANESYLRTATERVSLQEMAKLIGYRLRPGVAAEARLAFALEPPKAPPPRLPPDPGAFFTGVPTALTLPGGTKVQSVPGPDEKPQTFETVEAIDARPEWNAMRPWLSEVRYPGFGATEAYLQGADKNLKPGDALVLVDNAFLDHPTTNNNWDFRLVDSASPDNDNNRTRVTWTRGLGSVSPHSNPAIAPQVHVLRKRAGVFGNNAPLWRSMNTQFKTNYLNGANDPGDWPNYTISPNAADDTTGGDVDTDVLLSEVRAGSLLVMAKGGFNRPDENFPSGTYVELYKVTGTTEVSRGEFGISGKVSRLTLSGQNLNSVFFHQVRASGVFAQSERIEMAPFPVIAAVSGDQLPLAVPTDGLLAGRRLIVRGDSVDGSGAIVHEATIAAVAANVNSVVLTITPPLPTALVRSSVVVHGNVANATHGETVSQVLGAGDASRPFQRFELKRTPLTYRSATNETGADSELTVRVADIEWSERPTLFASAATDRAYALATDEHDKLWVQFGDGASGARLPSGVNNVRAVYRQGIGQAGNVRAETLTQLMTRPLGLKGVSNPVAAQGGTDPEPSDQARRTMPLGTRTLGRAVSLLDYEDFAMAFTGIAKAQAQVLQLDGGPTIAITIAGQGGATLSDTNPVWSNLLLALKTSGDPHVRVALLSYQPSTFFIGLKVKRDPAYGLDLLLAAVEAALREHFSFDARSLAQPVLQSDVIAAAHGVPGVVAVDLDFLYGGTSPLAQTLPSRQTRLLASRMRVSGGVALAAELLTLDPGSFARLEEMA